MTIEQREVCGTCKKYIWSKPVRWIDDNDNEGISCNTCWKGEIK